MPDVAVSIIAALYVVACGLPLCGLWRLWRIAVSDTNRVGTSDAANSAVYDKFAGRVAKMRETANQARKEARLSLWLIGGGLVVGTAASIWSLFV